ncbi:MAG: AAA family ATPase, partial [Desulfovibrio sp.]|nr:AAA family ATPase [Desulfovibrio sp.]
MTRTIAIGRQDFASLRQRHCFYVDKTKFLKEWWESECDVTLITRPRRFGKTLLLDTVKTFFSTEFAGQSHLFEGLMIWQDEAFRSLQGTIPVIALSFADCKSTTYETTRQLINEKLKNLFDDFDALLDHSLFSDRDAARFARVQKSMDKSTAQTAVQNLSRFLVRQHYAKPIILLDEYDTPLHEAHLHGFGDKLAAYLRGFFTATFKANPYLGRALITGITKLANQSIFSDMNNVATSKRYADCFGFTEQEVFAAMDEYGLTDKEGVKEWYGGFIFGRTKEIYNPWSITKYLANKELAPYWAQSSSNNILGDLIKKGGLGVQEQMARLLQGESITLSMDEQIDFSQLSTHSRAIWSLLMAAGYVKALRVDPATEEYTLTLTNQEVHFI